MPASCRQRQASSLRSPEWADLGFPWFLLFLNRCYPLNPWLFRFSRTSVRGFRRRIVGESMHLWDHPASAIRRPESRHPAARPGLSLPNNRVNKMMAGCEPGSHCRGRAVPRPLLNDALERGSSLRRFHRWRRDGAQSAGRALQDLLAPGFRLHLPQGLFHPRRPGSHPGFFSHGA